MVDRYSPYQTPLAIVGMGCRLPGADDLAQYWRLLIEGRSAVVELPPDRIDQGLYFDPEVGVRGKSYSKLGAIISSRKFDRSRCPIPVELERSVDNAHLLMCDVAASALRDAGMDPFNVPLKNTGVYIGHAQGSTLGGDYTYATCVEEAAQFLREVPLFQQLPPHEQEAVINELVATVRGRLPIRTPDTPDVSASLVAGTISKAFGLNGPYLAINSACASSLQAMLLGARALQLGRVDMAIVGGASDCKGDSLVLFSNARAMSATGSRPFDEDADGLICGEGYVSLVMKTLQRALDDGDRIWAVVRGLGVSSDGKGKSLWAPRKEGQIKAMERAYRGGLEIGELEYLEAHATATQLGDATELNTLSEILGPHLPPGKKVPITSVKANIGHSLETAGIAGVIKTVLAMHHQTIPPAINIQKLNGKIDWSKSPVYVPTSPVPWPKRADGKPRRAGCNAFGIGGLNMHVVLDEFTESHRAVAAKSPGPPAQRLTGDEEAVAVIGLGCVLPGAGNPAEFWQLLASGRDPKVPVPADRWRADLVTGPGAPVAIDRSSLVGGFITDFQYDWKRHKVPPKQVAQADPLQFMLLEASDQAMQDAGYDKRPLVRENVGVVVGTEFGGDFSFQLQLGLRLPELEREIEQLLRRRGLQLQQAQQVGKDYAEALLKHWPALIDETGSFSTSSLASRIGKTWNLMGGAASIDAGETSGLAALSTSIDMLLASDCDLMICAAGQRRMGWPQYESLALTGTLAKGPARSPLDAQSQGQVPGEGVVVLLLKRLADARRDGDRVHAILRGVGAGHDPKSWGRALQFAMERSFSSSREKPSEIGLLELDALGGQAATADEIQATAAVYGNGRQMPLVLSSVISQIGNTQGASSLVSLLKAILEVSHGEVPTAIGMSAPISAIAEHAKVLQAPGGRTAIELATVDGRRLAAAGTCSRGLAYHAIVEYGARVEVVKPVAVNSALPPTLTETQTQMGAALDITELEKFLINFVVEQTGYPPEVVELDADLEADLGIDSIKKAQMFGELQEYFDVTPTDNLTLDDFPTLRHIVNFLAAVPQKAVATAAPTAAAIAAPAAVDSALPPTPTATPQVDSTPSAALNLAELEKFLINFVVEQTGYPPEVVELDADLEADLGIDSIKKAQMFGELQEYFDVTPTDNLTLDDFPTLRHIVNFLAAVPQKAVATAAPTAAAMAAPAALDSALPPTPMLTGLQICRFGAADRDALGRLIEAAIQDPRAWESATSRRFTPQDRLRLAVVADGPATLATRLATALKQMDNPAAQTVLEQQGVFYREANPQTRIAFLFAGQGSQYIGMLRQLVEEVPAVTAELQRIDAVMMRLGYPTFAQLAWDEKSPLGKDVWTTQISMLLADLLMLAALRDRGIEPDLVAGHSYGEYPALYGAGAWDLEQAVQVTRWRCDSIGDCPGGQGGMLATTATPGTIEQFLPQVNGPVFVANHNAPDQTVVGGSLPALAQLEQLLQGSLFETRMLPVPSPFHTPLMREAAEIFRRHLARATLEAPDVTLYSVATNEIVRSGDEARNNLVAHLTTPVRYADLMTKLAGQGPCVFVEVGPQQALTRLNRRIFTAGQFAGIASDNPARPGVEQLLRVRALLECSGALDVARVRAPRPTRQAAVAPIAADPVARGQIWHFDATERRREKMRKAATKTTAPSTPAVATPTRATVHAAGSNGDDSQSNGHGGAAIPQPVSVVSRAASAVPAPAPAPRPAPAPAKASAAPVARVVPAAAIASTAAIDSALPPTPTATPQVDSTPSAALNLAELEKFLINFVVEQTGYPPEVVELDADLEADLGIDSIKKAQMFGELQEYFDVTPTDNLTLDDFPTLRHIVNFLAAVPQKAVATAAPTAAAIAAPAAVDSALPPTLTGTANVDVLHLRGTLREMGRQQGAEKKTEVRALLRRMADLTGGDSSELPIPAEARNQPERFFSAEQLEELRGLAEEIGVPLGNLAALNLAVRNDVSVRAAQGVVAGSNGAAGSVLHGLVADLSLPPALTELLAPMVEIREPSNGAMSADVTFAGIAGGLLDFNAKQAVQLALPTPPGDPGKLLTALGELPSPGTLRLVVVNDAERGDLLLQCGTVHERIHVGALLTAPPDVEELPIKQVMPTAAPYDLPDAETVDQESRRYVLRVFPMAWKDAPVECPTWKGAAAIHGNNTYAEALERRLKATGAAVVRLKQSASPEQAVAELEQFWREQPISHLFLTSHRDGEQFNRTDGADWDRLVERRMMLPYFLCQRWLQLAGDARRLDDCTVVALTDLGGDLGFSGQVPAPESGFLTGLMKSLYLEYQYMRGHKLFLAKAIEAPQGTPPDELASNILRELASGTNDYEVAFISGKRHVQTGVPAPAAPQSLSEIRPGSTWVITGGARGITAECGMELGRRFGLKLHLIGSSPLEEINPAWREMNAEQLAELQRRIFVEARQAGQKPNEAWAKVARRIEIDRNLRNFAGAGIKVTYHSCDVADRAAMARVLENVRALDGPIEGILHGAGIEQSSRFEKKTPDGVMATVGAKVLGAHNLMLLTLGDPVRHFIGFGSISGRMGSNGQTDYAAASDMLCKLIGWYRGVRPECHAVAFHWHPWDELGMAARQENVAMLKASNIRLMPMRTGLNHFVRELYSLPAESEVLVTDREYHHRYYPLDFGDAVDGPDWYGMPDKPVPADDRQPTVAEPKAKRVADRMVMRMVDAPLSAEDATRALPSSVLMVGDNPDAEALASLLIARSVKVERLPVVEGMEQVRAAVERAWQSSQPRCLMLLTARDAEAGQLGDRGQVLKRVKRGVDLPFWATQRWFQLVGENAQENEPATVLAVTSLGGEFGFASAVPGPEGGFLAGLLKSIFVEDSRYDHTRFRVKVIDSPAAEPPIQLAEEVCRELQSNSPEVEVGWSDGRRRIVATLRESADKLPRTEIRREGTWVLTGGGRGITAAVALELGQRFGLKLHLLGKSPAPQSDAPWRNCSEAELKAIKQQIVRQATLEGRSPTDDWDRVRKDREIQESLGDLAAAGVNATYHQCDVADWDDLERVLNAIRAKDGPIEGVVHGAGYAKSFRFGTGPASHIQKTIAPKVDGTLALMQLTRQDPLRYFIGFGSLSGRFGGNGLSDYAAANDMLAKLCGWFRGERPECHTTCLHWQTWDQIGMAMLSDGVGITKNAFKMDFIPPAEGVAHLVDELLLGAPESEVLVSDGFFQRVFYPYDFEKRATQTPAAKPENESSGLPLVSKWESAACGGVAEIVFEPMLDPFLTQHLLKKKPFLPGVIGVESLAEAATAALGRPLHELRSVRIANGLMFQSDNPIATRVIVTPSEDGLRCMLTSELRDRQGRVIDAARIHVEGVAPANADRSPITADPPGKPPLGWFPNSYPDDGLLYHGAPLRCLKEVAYQYDGGWGKIVAPPLAELAGPRLDQGWILPVAVLDACVVACGSFVFLQFGGVLEVPYEFERLRWARLPRAGETCVIRLFFRERGERHSRFDFALFGEDDEPLVQVEGYRTIRVGAGGR